MTASQQCIVMLTCQFDEILGGAEKQCASLSEELALRGYEVVVLTSRLRLSDPPVEQRADRLVVRRFWTYAPPQLAGRFLPASLLWAAQVALWIVMHRQRVAVLHVHQLRIQAFAAALITKVLAIPNIMKLGVGGPQSDLYVIGRRKYLFGLRGRAFVLRNASRFVATTATISDDLVRAGVSPSRIAAIPNGVRIPDGLMPNEPSCGAEKPTTRFVFLGRLASEKNVLMVISAFSRLPAWVDAQLDIFGSGPLEQQARSLACDSVCSDRIKFHGLKRDPTPLLSGCDFLILPSEREGLSNSLLEAMALGVIPIVSGGVSGCDEVVEDGLNGFVLERTTPEDLHLAMFRACSLDRRGRAQLSLKARSTATERFSLDGVVVQYQRLYSTLGLPAGNTAA